MKLSLLSTVCLINSAQCQTQAELTTYPEFADVMSTWGYLWEAFEVVTDDAWTLTLFHVTGTTEDGYFTESDDDHVPLLFLHDQGQDIQTWMANFREVEPLMLQVASRGYDVWLGNNRGTKYTIRAGDNTSQAYWDFTFADMAANDLPGFVNHIIAGTGVPQVTIVGYGQGSTQALYGIATSTDTLYNDKIHRIVAMAPCLFKNYDASYQETITTFEGFEDQAVYFSTDSGMHRTQTEKDSVQNQLFWAQLTIGKRFQEPLSLADYKQDQVTTVVDMSLVTLTDDLPVGSNRWKDLRSLAFESDYQDQAWYTGLDDQQKTLLERLRAAQTAQNNMFELDPTLHTPHINLIVAENDQVCSCSQAEEIYETLTEHLSENTLEKRSMHTWRRIEGKHWQFAKDNGITSSFVNQFIGTLESKASVMGALAVVTSLISLI